MISVYITQPTWKAFDQGLPSRYPLRYHTRDCQVWHDTSERMVTIELDTLRSRQGFVKHFQPCHLCMHLPLDEFYSQKRYVKEHEEWLSEEKAIGQGTDEELKEMIDDYERSINGSSSQTEACHKMPQIP